MISSSRWLLSGIIILLPVSALFAQVTDFRYDSGNTYREVILTPPTDGCSSPMCTYHKMITWGDDTPIKEFVYRGRDTQGNVLEFMNWRMLFPIGYNKNNPVKYPMIIMLHGSGESGRIWSGNFNYGPDDVRFDNNDANVNLGGREHMIATGWNSLTGLPRTSGMVTFPGIVIWPQVSYNGSWEGGWNNGNLDGNNRMASQIVEWVIAHYDVDPDRISLHGLSNGARGDWDLAAKRPDLFAAVLPMSGVGSDYNAITDALVTTPIWLFQGGKDTNPAPQASLDMINMLLAKGGTPTYTVYPLLGHSTWTSAYAEPNFFPFMLTANKKNIVVFGNDPNLCPGGSLKLGVSAGYAAYQWTLNGIDIPLATTRYYNATQTGTYAVRMTRQPTVAGGGTITSNTVTVGGESSSIPPLLTSTGSLELPVANGLSPGGDLGGVNNIIQLTAPLGYTNYIFYNGTTSVQNSSSNTYTFSQNNGAAADAGIYTTKVLMAAGCMSVSSNPIKVVWTNPQPVTNPPPALVPVPVPGSTTSMNVTWNDVSGETGYEVWRWRFAINGYSMQNWALVTILPPGSSSPVAFLDHGLRPNGKYQYKVRALYGASGATFSADSDWSIENADLIPPTAPSNLVASNITETQITLAWNPSSDDDLVYKYEIYNGSTLLTTVSGGTEGTPLPATTTTLSGLTPFTSYVLSVRAIDYSNNYSPFADAITASTIILGNGLNFKYYTYTGTMPGVAGAQLLEPQYGNSFDFTQTPVQTGIIGNFDISGAATFQGIPDPDNFVYAFDGYIQITSPGTYRFYIDSDEGSRLYLNGSLLINNDGTHVAGTPLSAVTPALAVGKYSIRITYYEQLGSQSLTLKYNTPATVDNYSTATVVPNSALYLSGTAIARYYLVNTPAPNPAQLSAWTTKTDGSSGGSAPVNFTAQLQYFTIANQSSVSLGSAWTVSGSGSKLTVGDNTNAITFALNAALTGTIDAKKSATINVSNASIPTFGVLDPASTVNFKVAGAIPNALYGNVNLQAAGQYIFPVSTTTIQGNLAVAAGATTAGIANNLSAIRIGGNLSFANTGNPFPANPAQQYSLVFAGGKTHTISFATPVDPALFALQTDFGDNIVFSNSGTHTYTFGSALSQGGGLILKDGSTLNIGANNLVVSGLGAINANSETGVIAMNNGNFTLSTTGIQNSSVYFSTTANQVYNFTTSTAANTVISILSQANIRNLVTLSGGELNSNNGALTLLSDATGTAQIGPIPKGARITGSITTQRYMNGGLGTIYRSISAPVKGFTVASLEQYIPVTGTFTGASTGLGTAASMFSYTEPNYVNFPASGGTSQDTLRRGKGYTIFVREGTNPTTWQATGAPNQGTIPFTLTPGSAAPNDGWNLLGNPFPSAIQWTGAQGAGWPVMTNITSTIYARHNFGTQFQWFVYRPGITTGDLVPGQPFLANGIIASGQAFWVQANASPALSIAEGAKSTEGGTYYRTGSPAGADGITDVLAIRMSNTTYNDITYIVHDNQGTVNYEKLLDAVKQPNSFFSLSTLSDDGISLVINSTPRMFCSKDIKLNIQNAATGPYVLTFFGPVTAKLQDHFTGQTTEIRAGATYNFTITTDPASAGAGRFVLSEKPTVLTNSLLKSTGACESNPSVTILTTQSGAQYQALFKGAVVSNAVMSTGDSLKLILDHSVLGYGTHTISLIAGFPGCDLYALDQTITVSVDTLQTPTITHQSGFLVASPANADHYQWLLDGSPLQGKTEQSLIDTNLDGSFQVTVSTGACSKVSAPYDITGIEKDPGSLVKAYPNPFREQITVTLPEKIQGGTATLTNPIGQNVQSVSIAPQDSHDVTLNFASVEAGPYVITVGRYRVKVVKIN